MNRPPSILDALIPGRYLLEVPPKTYRSADLISAKPHGWKLIRAVAIIFFVFWYAVFSASGEFARLTFIFAGWITPFALLSIIGIFLLIVAYPGSYYLYFAQARSVRWICHHLAVELQDWDLLNRSSGWVVLCRAWFLPGRDLSLAVPPSFRILFGTIQRALFFTPMFTIGSIYIANMSLVNVIPDGQALDVLRSLNSAIDSNTTFTAVIASWVGGFIFMSVSAFTSHLWLSRALSMPPEERTDLTP